MLNVYIAINMTSSNQSLFQTVDELLLFESAISWESLREWKQGSHVNKVFILLYREGLPNFSDTSLPPPYLKLFFTSFTFTLIATQQAQTVETFNYFMSNVNRNTAVAIHEKITKFLIQCSTMPTTYHISYEATGFLFSLLTSTVKSRARRILIFSVSVCLPSLKCDFTSAREVWLRTIVLGDRQRTSMRQTKT